MSAKILKTAEHHLVYDYNWIHVTSSNIYVVLFGDKSLVKGGSGKVVDNKPEDCIFLSFRAWSSRLSWLPKWWDVVDLLVMLAKPPTEAAMLNRETHAILRSNACNKELETLRYNARFMMTKLYRTRVTGMMKRTLLARVVRIFVGRTVMILLRNFGMMIEIPEFVGKAHPNEFIDWLSMVERIFDLQDVPEKLKVKLVAIKLRKSASLSNDVDR
nr:reverse transcriptase domain-containing protein [Tanacetum cinerariifolium]